ncbi:MAG: zinc-ribbon domain-containing protein [Bacilli bacterium]|nr:zinc-ribbon domain-containing protein [Bacilli bacterium]
MGFCPQCGSKLEEGAKFCVQCGSKLSGEVSINQTMQEAPKKSNGISMASMILGIIAVFWTFSMLLSISKSIPTLQKELLQFTTDEERLGAIIGFCIGYTLFSLAPGIISLILGIVGNSKQKNGKAISGIIMGCCAVFTSIACIIYIVSGV